ncbi:Sel1 domain protein repeat-containing protein [Sulfuricurvum kujiense DSM 16994]|uniref:beta-lactamase n=1 Tax=Sulfuricurvum kujiense (strain ATCC BAA-921 / DSM 16994 / JCM 11577 / YK-1) TaxID=709032 RepID=E4TXW6_SULKY|nr:tetratricopeptide repeat protein [Sulfuricurvum kujiense]ADR32879.1 Sel1 domain protein repeat-containing protein [Sulfuricurvum kujiense DSM 16994]
MKKYLYLLFFLVTPLFSSEGQQSFWETYTDALRGNKEAQFQVGVIFERGIGREENQSLAAQWFEKSAEQGHVDAQYNVAIMYAAGRGVDVDEGKAMMWLAKAAKQKDKEARKLLNDIIDGKLDKKSSDAVNNYHDAVSDNSFEMITPTTLMTKEGAKVCDQKGICIALKANTALTSTSKNRQFYKISGTVTKKGWQEYKKEGWIDENSVEIRR